MCIYKYLMAFAINNIKINKFEIDGYELYNNKSSMKDIADIMDDKNTRSFYEKYLSNWDDTKAMVMLLKTYDILDKAYLKKYGKKVSKFIILSTLSNMLKHKNYDKLLVNNILECMEKSSKINIENSKSQIIHTYNV